MSGNPQTTREQIHADLRALDRAACALAYYTVRLTPLALEVAVAAAVLGVVMGRGG